MRLLHPIVRFFLVFSLTVACAQGSLPNPGQGNSGFSLTITPAELTLDASGWSARLGAR